MAAVFDKNIVRTPIVTPGSISSLEADRIQRSIQINGLAILPGFVSRDDVARMSEAALSTCDYGYDIGAGAALEPVRGAKTLEFRHPYLVSKECVDFVTNESLLTLLESHLGLQPVVHNALFQISVPAERLSLDYHIDCGSVKALNPGRKFGDFRLRTVLYLSDVQSGGFSCILGSATEALRAFLPLPYGRPMPVEVIPADPERRVTVNESAGTLVIFNTHGLHRPEIPRQQRLVLNTWFAKKDFSGNLPPTLFSMKLVEPSRYHRLHVFAGERGCSLKTGPKPFQKPPGLVQRVARRLGRLRGNREIDLAYEG